MNSVTLPGATALVTNKLSRFLARLNRPALEAVAQAAIDQLDTLDGDADLEDDDPAGQSDEDGVNTGDRVFYLHGVPHDGPGCPIADTGVGDHDDNDHGWCGHFGMDQSHSVGAVTAFISLNDLSAAQMEAAASPLPRLRVGAQS
ncbi:MULTISPECIES: hypothetical protein [unclassified Sphingobium]|uniref:hypothetical protein n=1 Tax=unclassified Sphingobium TaxID=2611147 RepID=UPI000D4545D0|nr:MULTISPECIES: hypothetical protein [unclassified Sphingobium]PSO12624.1 hypothetical protein C7E20_05820 [Sphingobium sp. AEW4]TWD09805.1 hypothetical protein FB595_104152 [Sphingobium sp. AEW010]TWD26476.1 hypothetical protein FB596_104152 [Sphingobium sp. AEW013]TWD27755.1 hypothetical protein FB594_105176 [Sphingobium sp. AEW001]